MSTVGNAKKNTFTAVDLLLHASDKTWENMGWAHIFFKKIWAQFLMFCQMHAVLYATQMEQREAPSPFELTSHKTVMG